MKQIIKFSIIAIIAIGVFACHRQKADFIGPGYIDAPKGFTVTSFTTSTTSIDLSPAASAVLFNATFPATVSWVLTITGQKSGAISTLKGTSNGFTGEIWKGVQDNIYFFRKGENVTATLSFYGTTYTTSLVINLINV
ncbi:MAG TPA: hypothetical protein VNW06_07260, partial [Cytophagaceae bacterium]|nr:hypothetical protein [Cytophagaceae bacterium]